MVKISLAGKWKTQIKGQYREFILPGSACENQVGKQEDFYEGFCPEAIRAPKERFECLGELVLLREIELPEEVKGKYIELFLERVNVSSRLFIDNIQIDREILGLSTPHVYNLTGKLTPGKHLLKLVLNNTDLISLCDMASGYSKDTGGYWNGVVGRVELRLYDICHINSINAYPKEDGTVDVKLELDADLHTPSEAADAEVEIRVMGPDEKTIVQAEKAFKLHTKRQRVALSLKINEGTEQLEWWDEFNPALYKIEAEYFLDGKLRDRKEISFGMRCLKVEDKRFILNGKQIAIRGTVDCAMFPKTGYPAMDEETWQHNLSTVKEYGLNLVRFHGWCPPEVAFNVADRLGIYLQVEMPLWLNHDVTAFELGEDSIHYRFFFDEARRILKEYGNHPSFMFFSNGNENLGDYTVLEDMTAMEKALDGRHLYAVTSNFDHPVNEKLEDFFLAARANGKDIRIQNLHDEVALGTDINFRESVQEMPVPIVNFEVGQYCVYPDVDIIEKYDGAMLPVNFDVIKKEMIKAGVYDRRAEYIKASGRLAAMLYKEDIEAVLRTESMGGFQLLALSDYTGQNTATIGMLDVFYNSKGIIEPKEWKRFCGPVVPLFESRRIYKNTEEIKGCIKLYNFGKKRIENPLYHMAVYKKEAGSTAEELYYEAEVQGGSDDMSNVQVNVALSKIQKPTRLKIEVSVGEYVNSWNVFVFVDEAMDTKKETSHYQVKNKCTSTFIPPFWSPVFFETDQPNGAIIDVNSAALKKFPTDEKLDYQWKSLLDNAVAVDKKELGFELKPIVELVPNFKYNKQALVLFERTDEKELYCGFDLDRDEPEAKCLKNSIYEYAAENNLKLFRLR